MKFSSSLLIFFTIFCFLSCSTDDNTAPSIETSTDLIEFEAEGGQQQILVTGSTDWQIEKVLNETGNNIIGDIYSSAGELLSANSPIYLEGRGYIESLDLERGFIIIRGSQDHMNIALLENSSGESFKFTVVLKAGETLKEIEVIQKKSEGYQFESITYQLQEKDGDSIFTKRGTSYKFDLQQPQPFSFSPFNGIDINNNSRFESKENDAFVWLENDSIQVKVPTIIMEDQIYFDGGRQQVYNDVVNITPHGYNTEVNLNLEQGESEFGVQIEFRERKVSYVLKLVNNRTGEEKLIEGKWIEVAPTGDYTIIWEE